MNRVLSLFPLLFRKPKHVLMYFCFLIPALLSIFKFAHGNEFWQQVMVMHLYVCLVEYALGTSNKGWIRSNYHEGGVLIRGTIGSG